VPDPATPKSYRIRRAQTSRRLFGRQDRLGRNRAKSAFFCRNRLGGTSVRSRSLTGDGRRLCPRRSARARAARVRAPPRAGRTRGRGGACAEGGRASRRGGGNGRREESRLPRAGARVGPAGRRRHRDEGVAGAAPLEGRPDRGGGGRAPGERARPEGARQLPVPPPAAGLPAVPDGGGPRRARLGGDVGSSPRASRKQRASVPRAPTW
jgi:hypothetical protein